MVNVNVAVFFTVIISVRKTDEFVFIYHIQLDKGYVLNSIEKGLRIVGVGQSLSFTPPLRQSWVVFFSPRINSSVFRGYFGRHEAIYTHLKTS